MKNKCTWKWQGYPDAEVLARVRVRLMKKGELQRWNEWVDQHHYLNSRLVGPQLRYVAELDGEWVVLMSIGGAAIHLEDQDRHIGWDDIQRGRRLKFIGQNNRLVVLADPQRYPNLDCGGAQNPRTDAAVARRGHHRRRYQHPARVCPYHRVEKRGHYLWWLKDNQPTYHTPDCQGVVEPPPPGPAAFRNRGSRRGPCRNPSNLVPGSHRGADRVCRRPSTLCHPPHRGAETRHRQGLG